MIYQKETDEYFFVMLNKDNELFVVKGLDKSKTRRVIPEIEKDTHPFMIAIDEN